MASVTLSRHSTSELDERISMEGRTEGRLSVDHRPRAPRASLDAPNLYELQGVVQHYAWGRNADDSTVAQLVEAGGSPVDRSKCHAELWMGTHSNGPASLKLNGDRMLLKDILGGDLPFLLKVLSVNTALSIQSHPSKALAEKLHSERPDIYKDPNHKPEMAIALSRFEALCGFCSVSELEGTLRSVPELAMCCGQGVVDRYLGVSECETEEKKRILQELFTSLMTVDQDTASRVVRTLVDRLEAQATERELTPRERLVLRLQEQYPLDIGVLSSYLLNYVCLESGEAIALGANEPHAYLSGEIVECMATSDNVIRAGLTPKFKDVDTLCSSLTYRQGACAVMPGQEVERGLRLYRPEFDEFEVWRMELGKEQGSLSLNRTKGPVIAFCLSGSGRINNTLVKKGTILFVPADTAITVRGDVVMWAASENKKGW